jgi:hypothetical protein
MGTKVIDSQSLNLSEREWYPGATGYGIANAETLSARGLRAAYVPSYIANRRPSFTSPSPWLRSVASRLVDLTERPADWDSYGSEPANLAAANTALSFLTILAQANAVRAPFIGGLADGAIQVEWYSDGRVLQITFDENVVPTVFYRDASTHEAWTASLEDDVPRLATLLTVVGG